MSETRSGKIFRKTSIDDEEDDDDQDSILLELLQTGCASLSRQPTIGPPSPDPQTHEASANVSVFRQSECVQNVPTTTSVIQVRTDTAASGSQVSGNFINNNSNIYSSNFVFPSVPDPPTTKLQETATAPKTISHIAHNQNVFPSAPQYTMNKLLVNPSAIFLGKNYDQWCGRLVNHLARERYTSLLAPSDKEVAYLQLSESDRIIKEPDYFTKQEKAKRIAIDLLSDEIYNRVKRWITIRDVIAVLDRNYLKKSALSLISAREAYTHHRYDQKQTIIKFIRDHDEKYANYNGPKWNGTSNSNQLSPPHTIL